MTWSINNIAKYLEVFLLNILQRAYLHIKMVITSAVDTVNDCIFPHIHSVLRQHFDGDLVHSIFSRFKILDYMY